ncbi:hypothetical protein CHLRE_16g676645v5 [Chlamydomonas reinhardtii]|uniref:Dynein regulatory complex protein 8 n=1 Tax=Chlamydomonas reinhardtii TaxID=3055 RepID=DRC8_CHLRE|nr:uncharacterized protein CHLRE_16g676645v5 [Chlamydomonas reinhardtii]A8J3A0.1 RecName: Full=Dynein regulatory complex protein 8; AltName: Full=Flagellar associated protein 200 [Chlamydomonas reinhardtii]8GLV_EZ Chain EZ, Dynein regulatory complex protein 8 [Chlamydomonas reinhardtii]8GLV_HF Chain HF, Dynein regulatory complex protein 8 [Chlamydomonas reinhardtii]8GLV_HM Chain HM, Dynein regulatory complex protein 8 [Chlamydomonas reinhardtii]PNW72406.1 hypothetical protein CHLRE_16g676645v5|eukprot:XP_001695889.1 flagellar associated protein [Chlamydomonas reinhardtii]
MSKLNDKHERVRARVREAFILFEHKEGSRLVDFKDVPTAVRACGVNPTAVQMTHILDQLAALNAETDATGYVGLENFELVVCNFLIQQEASLFRDDYHTLLRAFRAFDPDGRGFIDAESFKSLLTGKGEALSEDELAKMMTVAADGEGKIWYEDYAQRLANDGRTI